MRHIKTTTNLKSFPVLADSALQKQQQIEVWNSGIKMLGSLFDLIIKVLDKVKSASE